jgi:hypothetical protein
MPRGIAAHYTTSATPTTEPTTGLEKRAFRASAITAVTRRPGHGALLVR